MTTTNNTRMPQQGAAPSQESTREVKPIDVGQLRPYISVMVLEITGDADPQLTFAKLDRQVRAYQAARRPAGHLIGEGVAAWTEPRGKTGPLFDEATGLIWRRSGQPSWAMPDSSFENVDTELTLYLRRGRFIAVHAQKVQLEAVLRWLDKAPRPALRRVSPGVLNASYLEGKDSKNLWLRGIRGSSRSRADSKALAGLSLSDALDPLADGAFSLSSARVSLPEGTGHVYVNGTVGATPGAAKIWNRRSQNELDFVLAVREILDRVEATAEAGIELSNPFPVLATPVSDLSDVGQAFEFRCTPMADVMADGDVSDDRVTAAMQLQDVAFSVDPAPQGHDALLRFHRTDGGSGVLRASVSEVDGRVSTTFGFEGHQTDPSTASAVLHDLNLVQDFSIHYTSGHAANADGLFRIRQETAPFQNWEFRDFAGYNLMQEKPTAPKGKSVHHLIAQPGDTSLFAWVASTYSDGVLLCDDGTGEIADFLHIGDDGTLRFIHVKGAHSSSLGRRVSVSPYEVVVGQAVKNLVTVAPDQLAERLQISGVPNPAAWSSGRRIQGRQDFLEMLAAREPTDTTEVVVVQPHVTETHFRDCANPARREHLDSHRMRLLHTLLNAAQIACISSGAKFVVVGSA